MATSSNTPPESEEWEAELFEKLKPILPRLLSYVHKQTRQHVDAEDVYQNVLKEIFENYNPENGRNSDNLPALAFFLASHRCRDYYRRDRYTKETQLHESAVPADERDSSVQECIKNDFWELVFKMLDPAERGLFDLRIAHGYSWSEIADRTSSELEMVKSRFHRLLGKLRKHFRDPGDDGDSATLASHDPRT